MTWRIESWPGMQPKHWRFFRDGAELPAFTVTGDDEQVMHVLEALNAYERAQAPVQPREVEPAWDVAEGVPA